MRRYKNGLFMGKDGVWRSAAEISAKQRPAKVLDFRPKQDHYRATISLKDQVVESSISPKADLHELLLWTIQHAIRKRGAGSISCPRGREVFSVDRDPHTKRWFVRRTGASNLAVRTALDGLLVDRMLLSDPEDKQLYWVVL